MTISFVSPGFPIGTNPIEEVFTLASDQATSGSAEGVLEYDFRPDSLFFELASFGMSIKGFALADAGEAEIDSAVNGTFRLVLFPQCVADANGDGVAGVDDVEIFADAWLDGLPIADADRSGQVDFDDIDLFVESFLAGCG